MFNKLQNLEAVKYISKMRHPFVVAILCTYALFTLFGINGSSVGVYSKDSTGLLASDRIGRPRPIRSDEWLVNTQLTIAQKEADFPRINPNVGEGEDVSVVFDVPYKEWSTIFKPQNIAFLILPFANAFALKWWFSTVLLAISTYFISMFFLKKRKDARLLSSLIAIITVANPMMVWWHQSTTITALSLAYLLVVLNLAVRSVASINTEEKENTKKRILLGVTTAYAGACWLLLMYPPFQLANAWVVAFVFSGYAVSVLRSQKGDLKTKLLNLIRTLSPYIVGLIFSLAIFALFLKTRMGIIEIIQSTAYPGRRNVHSGGVYLKDLLFGAYDYSLQFGSRAVGLSTIKSNQSEFSSFGPFWITVFTLILLGIYESCRTGIKNINYKLAAVLAGGLFVAVRMLVSISDILYKPSLLHMVPHNRLKIALVPLILFGLIFWIEHRSTPDTKRINSWDKYLVSLSFIFTFVSGLVLSKTVAGYLGYPVIESLTVATIIAAVLALGLKSKFKEMLYLMSAFSLISMALVNPLQRGLGKLDPNSDNFRHAKDQASELLNKDDLILENSSITNESLTELLGYRSLTAVYGYPQLSLWKDLDQTDQDIYNRYAHFSAKLDTKELDAQQPISLKLEAPDSVSIEGSLCSLKNTSFNQKKVTKIISSGNLESPCLKQIGVIDFISQPVVVYLVV